MKAITLISPLIENSNAEIYFLKLGTVFIALRGRSSRKALKGRKLIPATGKNYVMTSKTHEITTAMSMTFHQSRMNDPLPSMNPIA